MHIDADIARAGPVQLQLQVRVGDGGLRNAPVLVVELAGIGRLRPFLAE